MSYQYIASPYTHKDPEVVRERVRLSAAACAKMLRQGGNPYSPIVHGYAVEVWIGYALPYEAWLRHGLALLKKADSCYILTLPGWRESKGVAAELELAKQWGIPIGYLNPKLWCEDRLAHAHTTKEPTL